MKVLVTGGSGFIGTNLIEQIRAGCPGWRVVNVDIARPKLALQAEFWADCDILNWPKLHAIFDEFRPEIVIHLGARTDMAGKAVEDYRANSVGTANVIEAVRNADSVSRAIFTSTQYVVGPGRLPSTPDEYRPHTVYGESKVLAEKAVQSAALDCVWTIIRPTNVWGPWHPRYPYEFWRVLKQGRYIHPGGAPVVRSYAYVGTVISQILRMLELPAEKVDRRVFYVGDAPINLIDWVNAFSLALRGKRVTIVPRPLLRTVALLGDAVNAAGGNAPLFSSRFRSMTEDYPTPMQWTFQVLGEHAVPLQQGVERTVQWLRTHGEFWR